MNSDSTTRRWLQKALRIAQKVDTGTRFYFGGVLVKKGRLLSTGVNRPHKTHPLSRTRFQAIHCELDTIIGVPKEDLRGATLYIARVGGIDRQTVLTAFPCSACQSLIVRSGIRAVYSTASLEDSSIPPWTTCRSECCYWYWDVKRDVITVVNW